MKVEVFFSPAEIQNDYELRNKKVVAVDVLRASSSIITAVHHGARQIIPVATVSDAMRLAKSMFADNTILCGERGGKLIDGFDIDNSPANYRTEVVRGQTLFFTSTNGSAAILKTKHAKTAYIGGFVNINAVVELLKSGDEAVILCAGEGNRFAMEDALCAGMMVSMLTENQSGATLDDGAVAAKALYDRNQNNMMSAVRSSNHALILEKDGFGADVNFCATTDVYREVPVFNGTVIKGLVNGG